jgi:hypothetical protein
MSDNEVIVCGGNAKPTDLHLLSTVCAVDEEIFEFLERRERRRSKKNDSPGSALST